MLNFPSYSINFFFFLILTIFSGVVGTILGVIVWKTRQSIIDDLNKGDFKIAALSIAFPIFFLVGIYASNFTFVGTYRFRSIDISTVTKLEIVESNDEWEADGKRVATISDSAAIQEMLGKLQKCREYFGNRERFKDGYKIKLIFSDEKLDRDYYLAVYRKNSINENRAIVIPQFLKKDNSPLGEFECPEFHELVKTHIDPLL